VAQPRLGIVPIVIAHPSGSLSRRHVRKQGLDNSGDIEALPSCQLSHDMSLANQGGSTYARN
jgi:hypothetical protein